ncbi:MAG: hypothetical protein IJU72_09360 [Bacteroidales bacterium]|nr:hypothetical protein [Bacteroidales bacterium]
MNLLLCTAINAMLAVSPTGGDTASVMVRAHEWWAPALQLSQAAHTSPALRPLRHQHSLSELNLRGHASRTTAALEPQTGLGWQGIAVHGRSHRTLRNEATAWGDALYQSGMHRSVRWNETADYQRLRPYVAADSLGGHLHSEQYQFEGGTAFGLGEWTLGGELGFSALQEHRRTDPRPRNRFGTMQFRFGLARNVGHRYALGIDAAAQKYKQRGTISYYNERGVSSTYHLQGLGLSYARFDGSNTSTSYSGHLLEAGLGLAPTSANGGLSAALRTTTQRYEKVLIGVNDLVLNELRTAQHLAEVGWRRTDGRGTAGVSAQAVLSTRTGTEVLYGDAANNEYPRLSSAEQYSELALQAQVMGLFERIASPRWRWHVLPGACYAQSTEKHLQPHNELTYSHINAQLALGSTWRLGKTLLLMRLGGAYGHALQAEQMLTHTVNAYARRIETERYDMARAHRTSLGAQARVAIPVGATLLHIDIEGQHAAYSNGHSAWDAGMSIGLCI